MRTTLLRDEKSKVGFLNEGCCKLTIPSKEWGIKKQSDGLKVQEINYGFVVVF